MQDAVLFKLTLHWSHQVLKCTLSRSLFARRKRLGRFVIERVSGTREVRVATLNLWGLHGEWEERRSVLVDGLRELRPDVIAFQEAVLANGYDQVADLLGARYHVAHQAGREANGSGCSVASRWPLGKVQEVDLRVTPPGLPSRVRRPLDRSGGTGAGAHRAPAARQPQAFRTVGLRARTRAAGRSGFALRGGTGGQAGGKPRGLGRRLRRHPRLR